MKPHGAEIEGAQILLEVDVEPLAAGGAALPLGHVEQATADARVLPVARDDGVDDEGVHPAVPGHVDEPDQTCGLEGADPSQAVTLDLAPPVDVAHGVREALGVQGVEVLVGERRSPLEAHRASHGGIG